MNQDDKQRNFELAEKLISEQNFSAAVIAGAVSTILSAAFYGIVTSLWVFSYGFAAAAIGIAVGISMQFLGRGITMRFAVVASVFTIAGCALGTLFQIVMELAKGHAISPLGVFRNYDFSSLVEQSMSLVSIIGLLFWFISAWFAGFLAKRPLSRTESLAIGMYGLNG